MSSRLAVRLAVVGAVFVAGLAATTPAVSAAATAPAPAPAAPAPTDPGAAAIAAEQAPLPADLANAHLPTLPAVAAAATAPVAADSVAAFGDATDAAAGARIPDPTPLVGMAGTADGKGYWVLASDGGVFSYGDAPFMGSIALLHLAVPATAIVATPDARGYWILVGDGRVFSFGDARFAGAIVGGDPLGARLVGMAPTADGGGYWLVTGDGRIFSFGDAIYGGGVSAPGARIVSIVSGPAGGYWLAAADGRVFSFGGAHFAGAVVGNTLTAPVVGMARTKSGNGYWLLEGDGTILPFGDAVTHGSIPGPAAGIAASAGGGGYWVFYGSAVSPFNADAIAWLQSRSDSAKAAVFDATTGRTFVYRPGIGNHTASIVKVDIMATLFAELATAHRSVSATELGLLHPMIEQSNNAAASALWNEVGAGPGVAAFNTNIPLPQTTPGPDGLWGLTLTTPLDQIALIKTFAFPNHVLSDSARALGMSLMESVIPSQRWGISGGVPAGVTIANKNGWSPLTGHGWIVNSIGVVEGQGRHYVIAVLTEDNPSMAYGISTIEGLAARVWQNPSGA